MSPIVNLTDINLLLQTDDLFIQIKNQYGAPPNWSRPQGFVTLSRIILEQQVSLQSANAHYLKLNNYIAAFTPDEVLKLTDTEMRACQVSRQKATYLRSLSSAILEEKIALEKLAELSYSEIREQLKTIKGIGDWTADIYLMFCLQAKDIFPIGDVAIVNTMRELTTLPDREAIIKRAAKWKPLRSLATYYLWHYYLGKRKRNAVF